MTWSPDGKWFVTASHSGGVNLWNADAAPPRHVQTIVRTGGHGFLPGSIFWSPDGRVFSSDTNSAEAELIFVCELADGKTEVVKPSEFTRRLAVARVKK